MAVHDFPRNKNLRIDFVENHYKKLDKIEQALSSLATLTYDAEGATVACLMEYINEDLEGILQDLEKEITRCKTPQ